jgi:hypothetical protein
MSTWEYHSLQRRIDDEPDLQPNWPVIAGVALCLGFWLMIAVLAGAI